MSARLSRSRSAWTAAALLLLIIPAVAPAQLNASPHLKTTVEAPARVAPGAAFDLIVRLEVDPGFHIQGNDARDPYIPTRVEVAAPRGFTVRAPAYPASKVHQQGTETLRIYEGAVRVRVPVVASRAARGVQKLRIKIVSQACDAQSCFPPADSVATTTITVAAGKSGKR